MQRYDLDSIEYYNSMFRDYPDIVNVKALQEMLHIGERHAYELLKSGAIPSIRFDRGYRIPKVAIIAYLYKSMKG
jgi:excisionase family DNA binding protein